MKEAILTATLLALVTDPAMANECDITSVELRLNELQATGESYVLGLGTMTLLSPVLLGEEVVSRSYEFEGRILGPKAQQSAAPVQIPVTVQCGYNWCSSWAQSFEQDILVFLHKGETGYRVLVEGCVMTRSLSPTAQRLAAIDRCFEKGMCGHDEFYPPQDSDD